MTTFKALIVQFVNYVADPKVGVGYLLGAFTVLAYVLVF